MLVASKLRTVISPANSSVEESHTEMNYLVLHVTEDDSGNPVNTWELIKGRQAVVDAIYDILKENGYYNFFKSNILSEKVNMNKSISVYTFIRRFLESDDITLENWGIENLDDFNDYIFGEDKYQDDMSYQGIDSMEDLNKFFIADIQHKNFFQLKNEE